AKRTVFLGLNTERGGSLLWGYGGPLVVSDVEQSPGESMFGKGLAYCELRNSVRKLFWIAAPKPDYIEAF
ncbi:MAG: hypothetical protein VYC44_05660, partial [Chloroflexota bacterium]|nr:hypothetical protein [Chloroflexota bacterium]